MQNTQQQVTAMFIAKQPANAVAQQQAAQLATIAKQHGQACNAFMQQLVALNLHCIGVTLTQQQMVALVQGVPPSNNQQWHVVMQLLGAVVNGWQIKQVQ